ncbi:MAG: hypothetical protein LBL66_04015 [Clostridiales bacterium]|jgi:antitoxin component HigA of HigAB toxin-antitoxin module|nr:hypothetical protein [Clostridiales bacterium]
MPESKKLKGIKPFNGFLFRSCYYHQLIAAYARYGVDERLLIMNYVPLYDKKNFRNYDGLTIFTERELEELSGIRLVKKKAVEDITGELVRAVDGGSPAVVAVDCFYLPHREDTFHKRRLPHFLLVYGYDRPNERLIINEHSYLNSIYYAEREISFDEIRTAYESYTEKLAKEGAGFIKIKRVAKRAYEFSPAHYVKAYYDNREKITESVENLIGFCEHVATVLSDKKKLDAEIKKLIEDFGFIRLKKNVQRYQTAALFGDGGLDAMNARCMDGLIFIYGLLAKINITNCYNEKNVEKIAARLQEVIEIERKLHGIWMGKYHEIFC